MNKSVYPVLLIHGWNSHPGIWKKMITKLEEAGIPAWNFGYAENTDPHPVTVAEDLHDFIADMRRKNRYHGEIDIITHSMGTHITRFLLEVQDGKEKAERVRQFIGIGPPNNGSSMAELFCDPVYGEEMIRLLDGIFVPPGYDPGDDSLVQEVRPGSVTMATLKSAGLRDDIRYRCILSRNITRTESFFPILGGRTWIFHEDGSWDTTFDGDGVIPHSDSIMPGIQPEIVPHDNSFFTKCPHQFCHSNLPKNPEVIRCVIGYLTGTKNGKSSF